MSEVFVLTETPEWRELESRVRGLEVRLDFLTAPGNPLRHHCEANLQAMLDAAMADLAEAQEAQAKAEAERDEHKACRSRAVDDYTTLLDRFQKSMSDVHQLRKDAEHAAQSILRLTNERNRLESELAEWRSRGQA